MNKEVLEEKVELLRWVINLNDEQVIRNLTNFKNEIFGVPLLKTKEFEKKPKYAYEDPREKAMFGENYLKFEDKYQDAFIEKFMEGYDLEEAKIQLTNKISGWWRD